MAMRTTIMATAIAAAMMAMTVTLFAAEQPVSPPAGPSEPIYGYRMMNSQERNEFREKMRNARNADERQSLRDEHHKLIQLGPRYRVHRKIQIATLRDLLRVDFSQPRLPRRRRTL
jgi:hypothetical protein